ncbi:MAG: type II toxin-antitoxin system VapC family toxin [Desulfosarcina sp.]|nr:type II toxin-antitoxin system VapC family toxin [Desulfosarcina sp.]MBC2741636.1 type II toxin-antitoxin system VapC family toxin [Desulfosarcina sp.]MBC2764550.1 type II toxin-antitoxin system VapC family toxin [Desulfosarcina sp.]
MKLVLDTNIYCDFAEGIAQTVDILADLGQTLFLPAIVIGELSYGFMKGSRRAANERKIDEIIQLLEIQIVDVTRSVASKYGLIYLSLVQKGRKIPLNDVWIAACCMEVGGTLLTRDHHFEHVDQIDKIILT